VRVSAKADYAVRATVELARLEASDAAPAKGEAVARTQGIPMRFLENILGELRQHGLVHSRRGSDGGYWLAKPADRVSIAEVIRAVEGPLATVRGQSADELEYGEGDASLREVWLALRANVRDVLERVTLADIVADELPEHVRELSARSRPSRFTL
jgi:Rrf2 family protein